ncbi:hypothetical protein LT706_25135 [Pseudomonas syringae pv. syringae]|nr:hypothetical protein [Pseudomonas syringae]MCK9714798.1 hypothetical protein [Pseudomonas syringae pv. syringae]
MIMKTSCPQMKTPEMIISQIGVCSSSPDNMFQAHTACMNAGNAVNTPMSPALRAARVNALSDLRSARTELRHLKKAWIENYGHAQLEIELRRLQAGWQRDNLSAALGHANIAGVRDPRQRSLSGYQRALIIESARVKAISSSLRRKLIQDGWADSKMIDVQMAQDLGL